MAAAAASASAPAGASVGEHELRHIESSIERCYDDVLKPLDQWGLVRRKERCRYPMVLVVGNFSSGKSSFVNHLLGRREQDVGAAPTDSGFTLLLKDKHATVDSELNGSAVINDPELGFDELRRFGPSLEARLRLKRLRPTTQMFPDGVTLVDTPGLTDFNSSDDELFTKENMHAVLLWFATHSDMILFLFDPLKPGGVEQQDILLALLKSGQEGKLRYVFNKTDQLASVQDFVMTFGTLCWNMSKYVPRKEPPMFFTTFTPDAEDVRAAPAAVMEAALGECATRREELIKKIAQVPFERADNLIKQAEDTLARLHIAGKVGNEILRRGARRRRRVVFALLCLSGAMCAILHQLYHTLEAEDPFSPAYQYAGLLICGVCLLAGVVSRMHLLGHYEDILTHQLDDCFVAGMLGARAPARRSLDDVSPEEEAIWQQLKKTLSFSIADFRRLRRFTDADWSRLGGSGKILADLHGKAAAYRTAMGCPPAGRADTPMSMSQPEL